jgi:TPR repeat protein
MGNHSAQYAVGYMYYSGLGTPQDDALAFHWLTKAAKGGNQNAAVALQQIEGRLPAHLTHPAHHHKAHKKPHHAMHKHSHAHHAHAPNIPAPSAENKAQQQLPPLPAPIRT